MHTSITLAFLALIAVAIAAETKYTTKYDNFDFDQILRSDRLLRNYVNCMLDKGKCSPEGLEIKKHISDAIHTGCSKCTDKQKAGSKKIIVYMLKNKRSWWDELEAKYDPKGTYKTKYAAELKKEGVVL